VILEAFPHKTGPNRPWDDLHHISYFLPKLRRMEAREFISTVNGDKSCPINPLAVHGVYAEGNMSSIATIIRIDISRTPGIVENVFLEQTSPPKRFKFTLSYSKNFAMSFTGIMRKFQELTHELLSMTL
jgi:hypothetical protein